jgi:glycosyltransferase involved in cell wall biosynthesis
MASSLVVGVPASHAYLPTWTGHGRLWSSVLDKLDERVDLRLVAERDVPRTRPDVWLSSAHIEWERWRGEDPQWPRPLVGPQVAQVNEATWDSAGDRERWLEPMKQAVRGASTIITVSESSKAQVRESIDLGTRTVEVVYPGVDHEVFGSDKADARSVLDREGVPPDPPYVLCVSNLHPRKNIPALCEAVSCLAAGGFPHILVLVSSFVYGHPRSVESQVQLMSAFSGRSGRLFWITDLTDADLASLMAGAAAFCLPSAMEGFGFATLEAMACGAPCVVTEGGASPELVGDAGVVCPPTAEGIRCALEHVLSDEERRRRIGERCRARASQFRWDRTADRWTEILHAAAGRPEVG